MRPAAILTGLLLLGSVRPASAQLQIGPVIGFHAPSSKFHVGATFPLTIDNETKQHLAFLYGGEARFWFDRRFGVEGTLTHGGSDLTTSITPDQSHLTVTVGTVSALVRFPLGDLTNRVWFSGGATVVRHGGGAVRGYSNTSNVGAALGLGTQFQLAAPLRLDLGFNTLVYSLALRDSLGTLPSSTQVDFDVRLGLSLSLGRDKDDF